ncbi:uncharacterized mitochondrial protein-like protein [Tanacetum coccineum]
MTHPSPKRNMVPKAVLMRSGLVSLTTARPVNTAQPRTIVNSARPMTNIFNKAHSTVRMPINNKTTTKNSNFNQKVNTARPKAVLNAVKGNQVNAVKASACWVWKPKTKEKGVIDNGYSRHMTGNMSYLTNFEEIKGGYVAFGGNPKGRKITGIGSLFGKADEGFFVGYSINSKVFKVFNNRTRIVEENLHGFQFSENTPNIAGSGPNWLFDIDALTKSINYKPVVAGNQSNGNAGTKACDDAGKARMETVPGKDYILLPLWTADPPFSQSSKSSPDAGFKPSEDDERSWIEAMQEELLQFKLQKVWTLVDLPNGKRPIGTKWVFRNKKDKRGIVIRNKARLVAQGYTQQKDNGLTMMRWMSRVLFFMVRLKRKSMFVNHQDLRFQTFPDRSITGLQVMQKKDGIFISQDKYVIKILKKFGFFDVKTASTPIVTQKALLKDEDGEEVDAHLYRSMTSSLMYLTFSRPDIMFAVCACARYQVNLKVSNLYAVKRIFRYLKGQPKLGLWYPKDSPIDLVAYTDSDYARASLERKSTTGGSQFLGSRLISWQCKKQTVVANSTTEAEYVAASSCCGQNGIGVNAGDSKLILLGINLLLLGKVNASRHKLTAAGKS